MLYFEEPDSLWHPASLTKIMTAYLTFEAIKDGKLRLEDKIPCSLVATLQPPSKVGLPVGATLHPITGLFSWTPDEAQLGVYRVIFTATDDGSPTLSASETVDAAAGPGRRSAHRED